MKKAVNGFTLLELTMVLSIMAIVASIALPAFFSMRQEGMYTKAQKEVTFLQSSVENYWHEKGALPSNLTESICDTKERILPKEAEDPWKTAGKSYGYSTGQAASGENYYVIFTKGIGEAVKYEVSGNCILNKGNNIIVSNLPVIDD